MSEQNEQQPSPTPEAKSPPQPDQALSKRRGCRRTVFVLLLLGIAALAAWGYFWRFSGADWLWSKAAALLSSEEEERVQPKQQPEERTVPKPSARAAAQARPPASAMPEEVRLSSAEARALMQAIDELRGAIAELQEQLRARSETQRAERRLMAMLAWAQAADPSATVAEIALAWRRLAILEGADEIRQQADAAEALLRRVLRWQQQLRAVASALREEAGTPQNLIPHEGRWGWLGDWFRFYRSDERQQRARLALAKRLDAIADAMLQGRVPSQEEWELIRARALLALASKARKRLELPASLEDLARQLDALRKVARRRLREMQE